MSAIELLKAAKVDDALKALEGEVRAEPADAKKRIFLFQLLCVRGEWQRALTQIDLAAQMDANATLLAQLAREAIQCEALRAEIFSGKRQPLVFGEPPPWVGLMIQALNLFTSGQHAAAATTRAQALELAPAIGGIINGQRFEWLADADLRFGPILECILNGKYYWVPMMHVRSIRMEPPKDLRDVVWCPSTIQLANGGQTVALLPARYPGSESDPDGAIRLARRTDWRPAGAELDVGFGQRLFSTDFGDVPLLDIRELAFDEVPGATS